MKTIDESIEIAKLRLRKSWAENFPKLEEVRIAEEFDNIQGAAYELREDFVDKNIDDMLLEMAEEHMDDYKRNGVSLKDFL